MQKRSEIFVNQKKIKKSLKNCLTTFLYTSILIKHQCRGVEQLVARRAHNPKVAWFKSRPRNHLVVAA